MPDKYAKIRHAKIRRIIDQKYVDVHDKLTDCYYNKKPFRSYGILDKETFDKLHGLIFLKRDLEFHEANIKQEEPYPESEYNRETRGGKVINLYDEAKERIAALKADEIDIKI